MVTNQAKLPGELLTEFSVQILRGRDGDLLLSADRGDGESFTWSVPATKLKIMQTFNPQLARAVRFFLGEL